MLCYLSSDEAELSLPVRYWTRDVKSWQESVDLIAESAKVSKTSLTKTIRASAKAYDLDCRCSWCGIPAEVTSRSGYSSTYSNGFSCHRNGRELIQLCGGCEALAQKRINQEQLERAHNKAKKVQDYLCEVSLSKKTKQATELTYSDAVLLHSVLVAADDRLDLALIGPLNTQVSRVASSPIAEKQIFDHLFELGVLIPSITSNANAFRIASSGEVEFDWSQVVWTVGPSFDHYSYQNLCQYLEQIIQQQPTDQGELLKLWQLTALAECQGVLMERAEFYRFNNYIVGEKTLHALLYALEIYSIPQVWSIIHSVTKNAASLKQSREYSGYHAQNTIPRSLIGFVDMSVKQGWTVNPRSRQSWYVEPTLTTAFFNRVLANYHDGFRRFNTKAIDSL